MSLDVQTPYRTDRPEQLAVQLERLERSVDAELRRAGNGQRKVINPPKGDYKAAPGELVVVTTSGPTAVILPKATTANAGLSIIIVYRSGSYDLSAAGGSEVEGTSGVPAVTESVRMTSAGDDGWWNI